MYECKHTILYIHGMGGGADSRIPSVLNEYFSGQSDPVVRVVCRTYSFDPEIAHSQIESWLDECKPDLIVGESLGDRKSTRLNSSHAT